MILFFYGTLLDPATLAEKSGDPGLPERCRDAVLRGWRRVALAGKPYPTLRRAARGTVRGKIAAVGPRSFRALAAYEGPSYRLRLVVVEASNRRIAAHVWIAPGATRRPWP